MTKKPDLVCRLLAASATAYSIGKKGGIKASPQYPFVNFLPGDTPDVFQAGLDDIDAALVGEIDEGVLLALRGTIPFNIHDIQSLLDWINDLAVEPVAVPGLPGKVHTGFHGAVADLWDGIVGAIEKRMTGDKSLIVTGHSKGAGMAPIAAALLVAKDIVPADRFAQVVGFAMPKPGDGVFRDYVNDTFSTLERYSYQDDIVPHIPPGTALIDLLAAIPDVGKYFKGLEDWDYETVGTLRFINWSDKIVGDSMELQLERAAKLVEAIAMGEFRMIADDHSLVGGYCSAVCSADVCTGKTCSADAAVESATAS